MSFAVRPVNSVNRRQIDPPIRLIQGGGSSGLLSGGHRDLFGRAILGEPEYRRCAVAAGNLCNTVVRFKDCVIRSPSDRYLSNLASGAGVSELCNVVLIRGDQYLRLRIECQSRRLDTDGRMKRLTTLRALLSITVISERSTMLTYTNPSPSETPASGIPPRE